MEIDRIMELGVVRRNIQTQLFRTNNSLKAMIRSFIGFETSPYLMSEERRKEVVKEADKVFATLKKHKFDDGELPEELNSLMFAAEPFFESLKLFQTHVKGIDNELKLLGKKLPSFERFVEKVPGCGALGLALIIAQTGDLNNYPNPAKVWKRMGVGIVEHNGKKVAQKKTTDKELAIKMGFNPKRRSTMFTISEAIVKKRNTNPNEYGALYDSEKQRQQELNPTMSKMQIHLRAKRRVEKQFLKNLWRDWTKS